MQSAMSDVEVLDTWTRKKLEADLSIGQFDLIFNLGNYVNNLLCEQTQWATAVHKWKVVNNTMQTIQLFF